MVRATESGGRAARLWAAVVGATVIGAMLYPVVRGSDGFPLSNYPMFSREKDPVAVIHHVIAVSEAGNHRPLTPEHLGTDEIMQASQTAKLAVQGRRADELCTRAAAAVAVDEDYADASHVQVRVDTFDAIAYWSGDRAPSKSVVAAMCAVER
jgi:hypothetical protein